MSEQHYSSSPVVSNGPSGPTWLLVLAGDADPEFADEMETAFARAERESAGLLFTVDVGALRFCDSALLNLLLITARRRTVVLAGENAFMQRMLEVTGVGGAFTVVSDADAARRLAAGPRDGGESVTGV
ncbi:MULTISPECIES: STAS domain-containing protein [unclassified Streptomyces]|uniref:STAS domain-containing protein n=1 Tax=unclassified Streptomyces TaxID=2593676 RepID=UPI000DC55599|nr:MULTISPECIES: STAS domain-containing protein [unclassified Streptomyces]MYT68168.1 STAS domain-containing protein [Streptomyces sp. SID8367]RAJ72736.1 STAS domain-containing protein [Streptomyces sp. PsTaAH-137]